MQDSVHRSRLQRVLVRVRDCVHRGRLERLRLQSAASSQMELPLNQETSAQSKSRSSKLPFRNEVIADTLAHRQHDLEVRF